VTPSNRRVKRPQLPPDVLEASGIADSEPLSEAEPEPKPPAPPPDPPSRAMSVARAVLGVALVVSVSTAVAWAARRHIVDSRRFAVTRVDVFGCVHRTTDQIAESAGLAVGANIFSIDLDAARAKIVADPWIKEATLGRRLPGTIMVQVTEREPGALVALGDTYLASRDGEPFKKLEPGDPTDLPIVTGLGPGAIADDRDGAVRTIRRAIDLASDYDRSPLAKRAPLEEVHVGLDGAISVVVGKDAVQLGLGAPPFRRKFDQAARVLAELDKRGAKAETILLDNDAKPERVVVRMR
jgi:cell division protein FtsQ